MSGAASPQIAAVVSPAAADHLKLYELQKPFVEPMLQLCASAIPRSMRCFMTWAH